MFTRRRSMVRISRTSGMRLSVTFSDVSRAAARAGRAEFFAPLFAISPSSGVPPSITNLSISSLLAGRFFVVVFRGFPLADGFADVVAGGGKESTGVIVRNPCGGADDTSRAVAEFRVFRLHVDHEISPYVSRSDKAAGCEHVKDQLGGGACFEPCGARDDLGAGQGGDGNGNAAREFRVRCATDADGQCTHTFGFVDGAENVGRAAAGGDAAEDVGGSEAASLEIARSDGGIVSGRLGCACKRCLAPCNNSLDEFRRDVKSGRTFRGIQHAESSARPGADVKEAAVRRECRGDGIDRAGDVGQFGGDGVRDFPILVVDHAQHFLGGKTIDTGGGGIGLFRQERGDVGGHQNTPAFFMTFTAASWPSRAPSSGGMSLRPRPKTSTESASS